MNDDDSIVGVGSKIPFCRRGQSQVTGIFFNESSNQHKIGILVFGGEGLNYRQPQHSFLQDLWALDLRMSQNADVNFGWTQINQHVLESRSWPDRRSNFGYTSTNAGWMVLYGGERQPTGTISLLDDLWVYRGDNNGWLQLHPRSDFSPGPRKDSLMTYLPSGTLLLMGGDVDKRQWSEVQHTSSPENNQEAEIQSQEEKETMSDDIFRDFSQNRIAPFSSAIVHTKCKTDVYMFNFSDALMAPTINKDGQLNQEQATATERGVTWLTLPEFPVCIDTGC